jgi:ribosomal protein S18 acetylase RimI-like enzyme
MASEPGRLAAEARYIPDAEDAGELALTVLDDFQGLGLGGRMLGALLARAASAGLARLSAVVSVSNGPMLHLLTRRGWVLAEPADESLVVRVEISAAGGHARLAARRDGPAGSRGTARLVRGLARRCPAGRRK